MKNKLLLLFFCILNFHIISLFAQNPLDITRKMFDKVKSIKTLQYSFDSKERVEGKIIHEISDFKIQTKPFQVYMKQHKPTEGAEVLFVTGVNSNKAKVNPNTFPWVTLNLDPEGSLMLDKHHHSLFDGGFGYTSSLIEYMLNKYKDQSAKLIVYNGIVKIKGMDCHYLTFANSNYRLTNYTVKENETPLSISKKMNINYFSILDNNPSITGIDIIKPGTNLILPNDYASKMELYIQKDQYYPVIIKTYDNKGLFEEYTFTNVLINPVFKSEVFSAGNKEYNF